MIMKAKLTYSNGFVKYIDIIGTMRLSTLDKICDVYKNLDIQIDIVEFSWR